MQVGRKQSTPAPLVLKGVQEIWVKKDVEEHNLVWTSLIELIELDGI